MTNFDFVSDPVLADLAARAEELYLQRDSNTALLKLRQFAEQFAFRLWDRYVAGPRLAFRALVDHLRASRVLNSTAAQVLRRMWKAGNAANHELNASDTLALEQLEAAWRLAAAFERLTQDPAFRPRPFAVPARPELWIQTPGGYEVFDAPTKEAVEVLGECIEAHEDLSNVTIDVELIFSPPRIVVDFNVSDESGELEDPRDYQGD